MTETCRGRLPEFVNSVGHATPDNRCFTPTG